MSTFRAGRVLHSKRRSPARPTLVTSRAGRPRDTRVTLLFLALPSAEAALQRVRERVAQGGHSVPEAVGRRRFLAGKLNFEAMYKPLVDAWALYDNSNGEPILLSWGEK